MASEPYFDPQALRDLQDATDADTVREVIDLFMADIAPSLAQMRENLENLDNLGKAAHRLKGASGTIGLMNAHHCCLVIEQIAKGRTPGPVGPAIDALESAITEGMALLHARKS